LNKLWVDGVPTTNEYSQLVSSQAIYFVNQLIKRNLVYDLNWFRPWINTGGASFPMLFRTLRALGVRYVGGYEQLHIPEMEDLPSASFPRRPPGKLPGLWVIHELPDVNVGNYSPTEVTTIESAAEIITSLGAKNFDFARQAVLSTEVRDRLVPARDMKLSIVRGGLHVSGHSDGTSLVVLPQQLPARSRWPRTACARQPDHDRYDFFGSCRHGHLLRLWHLLTWMPARRFRRYETARDQAWGSVTMSIGTLVSGSMSINPVPSQGALQTGHDFRRIAIVAVKALISIGLITFLATRLDYTRLLSYWSTFNGIWIAGAIAVLLLEMCAIAGLRLKLMLAYVDARRPLATTVRIALCGFFFEQVTIGFIGGDAVRLWLLRQADIPLGRAIPTLVLDRACGSASLLLLSLLGAPALLALLDEPLRARIVDALLVVVAVGGIGVMVAFALMKLLPLSKLTGPWRRLGSRGQAANIIVIAIVFILAAITHLLNILVFWMLGQSLDLSMTFNQWFIVVPTVLLISMLPISIGGWGCAKERWWWRCTVSAFRPKRPCCRPFCLGFAQPLRRCPGAFSGSPARRQLMKIPAAASEFDYEGKQQPTQHPFGYGFSAHFIIQPLTR
jgi:hypothetical protein